MNRRDLKPKAAEAPSPDELRIALTVDRIAVTGIELTEPETERFVALLEDELKRRLVEQFAMKDTGLNAETLRFDLSEIALAVDQPGNWESATREIARRLALTLESAAMKGKG